jgi:hypothetical protein
MNWKGCGKSGDDLILGAATLGICPQKLRKIKKNLSQDCCVLAKI